MDDMVLEYRIQVYMGSVVDVRVSLVKSVSMH